MRFIISVRDNGVGMSMEKLQEVAEGLERRANGPRPLRIGINNVHDRIRLQYGDAYGIRIRSNPNEGTTVELLLPLKKWEEKTDGIESSAG
jgi:two-component system sensor histidine kinase YesM